MGTTRFRLVLATVTVVAFAPVCALAQNDSETPATSDSETSGTAQEPVPSDNGTNTAAPTRPFSGLFRGASVVDDRKQSLDLSASAFASYIQAGTAEINASDPLANRWVRYLGAGGTLNYRRAWDHASIGLFANGTVSKGRLSSNGDRWQDRWSLGANGGFTHAVGRRTQLSMSGTTHYSPYYELGLFAGGIGTIAQIPASQPGLDFVLAKDPYVISMGDVTLRRDLTLRSSIEGFYRLRSSTSLHDDSPRGDRQEHFFGGRYRWRMNRYVGLRVGYAYVLSDYGGNATSDLGWEGRHELELALDGSYGLGQSYALTRRTTFSFNVRPSVFVGEHYVAADANGETRRVEDSRLRFLLGGKATLLQTIGRTWSAHADYQRGASYEVGFDRLFLYDTFSAGVGGLLTRRLDFETTVAYRIGQVGFSGGDNGYNSTTARSQLRAAITRVLAAYAQYFYYRHTFDNSVSVPTGFSRNLDRQGGSMGLTLSLPLL
jgi:hypothetical protein